MFIVSSVIDFYYKSRLKNSNYRKLVYQKALNNELRNSKLGQILLRNLNEAMSLNNSYHDELIKWYNIDDFQNKFWESDLGYMWFEGNVSISKSYFDSTIQLINEKKIESVLDIGCGWGVFCNKCVKETNVKKVYGIDVSEGVINNAKNKYRDERILFEKKNFLDVNETFDLISIFGSIDYILPEQIEDFVAHMLKLAKKNVVIVNSLRKIPLNDFNELTSSVKITRYDIGYVHPIKYILEKLKRKMTFSYNIKRSGIDSVLICIDK